MSQHFLLTSMPAAPSSPNDTTSRRPAPYGRPVTAPSSLEDNRFRPILPRPTDSSFIQEERAKTFRPTLGVTLPPINFTPPTTVEPRANAHSTDALPSNRRIFSAPPLCSSDGTRRIVNLRRSTVCAICGTRSKEWKEARDPTMCPDAWRFLKRAFPLPGVDVTYGADLLRGCVLYVQGVTLLKSGRVKVTGCGKCWTALDLAVLGSKAVP